MKIHKFEIIVCDPNRENLEAKDVEIELDNRIEGIVHLVKIETKDDGKEWEDEHPLNFTAQKADKYFNET